MEDKLRQELELKEMAREFAQKKLYPIAEEMDEKEETPKEDKKPEDTEGDKAE